MPKTETRSGADNRLLNNGKDLDEQIKKIQ